MSSLGHRLIHGWSPSLSGAQLCPQGARLKGDPVMDSEARVAEENRRAREVVTAAKLLLKSDPGRSDWPQWWGLRASVDRYDDAQHRAQKGAPA